MKLKNANEIRANLIAKLLEEFSAEEDCGMIASNSFNMPVVSADGEEGWVEIVVKVTKDAGDDGYMKREQYADKVADNARKNAEREKAKAEKIARDNAKREKAKADASA